MSISSYVNHAQFNSQNANKQVTPQTEPIKSREKEMSQNNAGGFTFTLGIWGILDRFLMIGSEAATYYASAEDTTKQSFTNVRACINEDGKRVVDRVVEYSLAGRAPKNDPAIVVLALCAIQGNTDVVNYAYEALPKVCRIGTHLFLFVSILDSLGKWNAAAKRGISKWYTNRAPEKLAVQLLKYQQRNGWAHRDVLRLAHVKPQNDVQSNLFRYSVKGELPLGAQVPQVLIDFEYLKRATEKKDVLRLVEGSNQVTWEMVPTQFMKDKDVLFALLKNMGLTAMIRKLGALTANGVISPLSEGSKLVIAKLSDREALLQARVHPITLLQAIKQYSKGAGEKGSLSWNADQRVTSALDDAFYKSFDLVEKTDENYLIGVDCSGSMFQTAVNGSPNLNAAEVAAVMALAIAKNQPNSWIGGFNTTIAELDISPKMRLDNVLTVMRKFNWDETDCAQPMLYATKNNMSVDKFIVITDNETYTGAIHPSQALRDYRKKSGISAKSVVIGTSASRFTIADPKDAGMLDIAGFDSAAPQIIANL